MIVGELPQFPTSTTINRSNRLQNEGDRLESMTLSISAHLFVKYDCRRTPSVSRIDDH
jgi:hypothetical protein